MICRGNPTSQASFPPFLKRRKARPSGISASVRTNQLSILMFRVKLAAGHSSRTCANSPGFVDLERRILTLSFVLSGPSLSDLPAMSRGSLSQLAFPLPEPG